MKRLFSKKAVRLAAISIGLFLAGFVLVNAVGTILGLKYVSVFAAMTEVDKYEVRSRLLMEATDAIGPCTAQQSAEVWAEGLKKRSAALQYAVMTQELKEKYARQLESTFPNWVTGVSSPWVDQYTITKTQKMDEDSYSFRIQFSTLTSAGPVGTYNALISVIRQGEYWRVAWVETDNELNVYTGFQP